MDLSQRLLSLNNLSLQRVAVLFAATSVLLYGISLTVSPVAFVSSEVRFADASASGLAIVPASCPSNPHTSGECSAPTVTLTQSLSSTAPGQSFTVTYGRSGGGPATSCVLERYEP
jgi:hypothetical protein